MQVLFILLTLLLLAVALFALQNAEPVTVRFLTWETKSSLALVTLIATVAGALIAWLLGLLARLRRWQRARATAAVAGRPVDPRLPAGAPPPPPPGP